MNEQKKDAVINLRISSDLKKRLADKCWERKMKMTSAIEDAIEKWLEDESTQAIQSTQSKDFTTQNDLETRLERIEQDYLDRDSAIELIKEIIADAQVPIWDSLLELHQRDRDQTQQQQLNSKTEHNQSELEKGLKQIELAERWGISTRAISDAKKKKDQSDWEKYCQKYDPDELIWYVSGRKFYPNKTE